MSKPFPNGFDSWQETHYEICFAIGVHTGFDEPSETFPKLGLIVMMQGRGGLVETAKWLTDKFEAEYAGHKWGEDNEAEFYEAVYEFMKRELANGN